MAMTSDTPFAENEYPIVVDVETAGPNPSSYALLSIGACTLAEPQQTFYIELSPVSMAYKRSAVRISGLSLEKLSEKGTPPRRAMQQFAEWVAEVLPAGAAPLFTAFNAPFDWMFVSDYFHRYLGRNPFGHKALDIKAFYMGQRSVTWAETSLQEIRKHYNYGKPLSHHALQDAVDSAVLFRHILTRSENA